MKRLISTPCLEVRWEPRWPAVGIGFFRNGKGNKRAFIVLISPLVILVGQLE